MCQLNSLRQLFQVWNANPALGVRQLDRRLTSFSLRALMQDSDCDGLPDMLEARLLEKFRPYFKFSQFEGNDDNRRPADAGWYVRNCQVVMEESGGSKTIISNDEFKEHPENILNLTLEGRDDTVFPTDVLQNFRRTNTHLTVPDGSRDTVWQGASWDEVLSKGNVGFYGHVVPVFFLNNDYNEKPLPEPLYKIEYWLFCPLNDAIMSGALNHEADWMTVQLMYDPNTPHLPSDKTALFGDSDQLLPSQNIYSVIHWAHGSKTEFLISKTTGVFDHITNSGTRFMGLQGDSQVMFSQNPVDGIWSHPVVYIQVGAHEFYPTPGSDHDGASFSFLTSTPPNIGEVEFPVLKETDAAQLILRFNGFWGLYNSTNPPPPGPALHYAWSWLPNIDNPNGPGDRDNRTRVEIERQQNLTGEKYFE